MLCIYSRPFLTLFRVPYRMPFYLRRFLSSLKILFKRDKQDNTRRSEEPEYLARSQLLDSSERLVPIDDLCTHLGQKLPIQVVKLVARDILEALAYLHDIRGYAHNAIAKECILLSQTDMNTLISVYSDNESAYSSLYLSENSETDATLDLSSLFDPSVPIFVLSTVSTEKVCYQRRLAMRSPEAILGGPCDESADIWSLGCTLYELLAGESLFDPFFQTVEHDLTPDESHLIQVIEILGNFPLDLLSNKKNISRWFTPDGLLRIEPKYFPIDLEKIFRTHVDAWEVPVTRDFLGRLLQLRPQERAKARDLIDHPWLRGYPRF